MKEAGIKHLFINSDGKPYFSINGYGMLQGKTKVNDGIEHTIALRHLKEELKWSLIVDSRVEAEKVIQKKAVAPH